AGHEGVGRHALSTGKLQLGQRDGALAACDHQAFGVEAEHLAPETDALGRLGSPHLDDLAPELGERSRPWIETANAVPYFFGGTSPVDPAVFLAKQRRQGRLVVLLWTLLQRSRLQTLERHHHELGPDRGQALGQTTGGLV